MHLQITDNFNDSQKISRHQLLLDFQENFDSYLIEEF